MLKLGRKATKKIFEDYLNDRPQANPNACVRLLAMQYDRIDPVVRRTEIKSQIEHELISPELQKFLNAAYERYLLLLEPAIEGENPP
jgi:hypothetical protein